MAECFTCKFKKCILLTEKEKTEIARVYEKNVGIKPLKIPEQKFQCAKTGKWIRQIDPACEKYEGDKTLEGIRKTIAETAGKLRKKLNDEN